MTSREIKFRVWNEYSKKFYPKDFLNKLPLDVFLAGVNIQQFTGFLDEKGQEIYEGDILKYSPDYNESQGGQIVPSIELVSFDFGCFFIGKTPMMDYIENEAHAFQKEIRIDFEVIGNIYETPDLLK